LGQDKQNPPPGETQSVRTAQAKTKGRLTIGVALEGGGALGEAHIGVLKWFEEHAARKMRAKSQARSRSD
jgi:NTE family protein